MGASGVSVQGKVQDMRVQDMSAINGFKQSRHRHKTTRQSAKGARDARGVRSVRRCKVQEVKELCGVQEVQGEVRDHWLFLGAWVPPIPDLEALMYNLRAK